jgi:hypothetical protein
MRIAIHGKEVKGQQIKFIETFFETLAGHKAELHISSKFIKNFKHPDMCWASAASFTRCTRRSGMPTSTCAAAPALLRDARHSTGWRFLC